jgi:hypothetical protein
VTTTIVHRSAESGIRIGRRNPMSEIGLGVRLGVGVGVGVGIGLGDPTPIPIPVSDIRV